MNAKGSASDGRKLLVANFRRNTTVVASGDSTESTTDHQLLPRAQHPWRGKDDLVPARRHVGGGQRRAVVELHSLADLERVGLAVIRRLRDRGAEIADELRGVRWVLRIDPHQHAVERRHRVQHGEGALAVAVQARRGIRRNHIGQRAAALRRLLRRVGCHGGPAAITAANQAVNKADRMLPPPLVSFFPVGLRPVVIGSGLHALPHRQKRVTRRARRSPDPG